MSGTALNFDRVQDVGLAVRVQASRPALNLLRDAVFGNEAS